MENNGDTKAASRQAEHAVIDVDSQGLLLGRGRACHANNNNNNRLCSREMDSLNALSDTFVPSVGSFDGMKMDDSTLTFYQTSASMAGTPQRMGETISGKIEHPKLWMVRLALWLLSTWIGTFMLCGRASLSGQFPYFQRFSQVSLQNRERIVHSWSVSTISLLKMLFRIIKILTQVTFYTQLDENDGNVAWKAIGYCGPDPNFKSQSQQTTFKHVEMHQRSAEQQHDEEIYGPLYNGLLHLQRPLEMAAETLRKFGFHASTGRWPKYKATDKLDPSLIIQCDAVVVGSGSGGGVVAGVLAKAGYKVLVLEKGEYFARSNLSLLEGPTMERMYQSGGLLSTVDTGVMVLSGSTVGGGSAINWSASIRTPQHVINEWSNHHEIELFGSRLYNEALKIVCDKMGVQSDISEEGFNNQVLRTGCLELGYPVKNIPRNSPPDHYCGWCCFGCKDGKKKGTLETWLVDLVNSGNGLILPECEAIEVLHNRKNGRICNTATGVAFEFKSTRGREVCLIKSKVVIAACGAVATPALLKRSGLKNPNIGKNLHLHPVTMAWGYFSDEPLPGIEHWPDAAKKSYEGGIMTAMSHVVAEFQGSGYGALLQTPSLHPGMFATLMPWVSGADMKRKMCRFSRTAHIIALARDKGSGSVVSPSSISYKMDTHDEENLKQGIEKMLRILAAAGAEEIGTHNCRGKTINVRKASSQSFERFVKEESARSLMDLSTPICSAHQMGSCRMGVSPKVSVVKQTGETWEVEGLFVADSSVFPTALGVNPMVTIQAIAYCTAQSILDVLERKSRDSPE